MSNDEKDDITNVVTSVTTAKKRGRKSKKELEEMKEKLKNDNNIIENITIDKNIIDKNTIVSSTTNNNITVSIKESTYETKIPNCIEYLLEDVENEIKNDINLDVTKLNSNTSELKTPGKKRGRKPKGGKIIQQALPNNNNKDLKPNIILHLKCSLKDLQNNLLSGSNIESFNFSSSKNDISYEIINNNDNNLFKTSYNDTHILNGKIFEDDNESNYDEDENIKKNKDAETKEVWKKLRILEHNLHINNVGDKKSACFWCTYDFDNPPVYIPKHYIKDYYNVYGCFCSPECASAYLMEENIDSSSKFERYHLINHIYAKIYDYKKNIKPAPNPYYMLDKYYGNLTIQEFRSLLRNERLFLVVDKPLTIVLPELHEDNDDFIINNKIIPSNTYQIKKRLNKKQNTKNNIVNEKFGISQ